MGKEGFNDSRCGFNSNINTNLTAHESYGYREFLISNYKSSSYACHLFENLKEFKYSLSHIKKFNKWFKSNITK